MQEVVAFVVANLADLDEIAHDPFPHRAGVVNRSLRRRLLRATHRQLLRLEERVSRIVATHDVDDALEFVRHARVVLR